MGFSGHSADYKHVCDDCGFQIKSEVRDVEGWWYVKASPKKLKYLCPQCFKALDKQDKV